jgi:hypothetical protein
MFKQTVPWHLGRACAAAALAIGIGLPAQAQPRIVIVNGERLSSAQLEELDRWNCAAVPSGRYWLNPNNGQWGYAGDTRTRGVIGGACDRKPSMSERRQLYRPGEILSGN